jgi:outer membrane protein assembly factor BamB
MVARLTSLPGVRGGLAIHLGCGDGAVELALQRKGYVVHGISPELRDVLRARKAIEAAGKYGPASVDVVSAARLPYATGIVNLLIADDFPAWERRGVTPGEIARVLAPYGSALLKGGTAAAQGAKVTRVDDAWVRLEKPYPAGAAEFPDSGKRTSQDALLAPPTTLKWITGDYWPVTDSWTDVDIASAEGRVFYRYGQIRGYGFQTEVKTDRIVARDAFNGRLLWERIIPAIGREEAVRVARGIVFVRGKAFAAATGEELNPDDLPKDPYAKATLIDGKYIFTSGKPYAVDRATGQKVWESDIRGYYGIVADDKLFLRVNTSGISAHNLACVDLKTGKTLWNVPLRGMPTVYADGVLFTRRQRQVIPPRGEGQEKRLAKGMGGLCAYSAETGTILWEYEYGLPGHGGRPDIWPMDGLAWVHASEEGVSGKGESWRGLDPQTGKVVKTVAMDDKVKHRCSPHMTAAKYILAGGIDLFSPKQGRVFGFYAVRNTCGFGYMPANGMLYSSFTVCECFPHLRGMAGVAAEPTFTWQQRKDRGGPDFAKGPAFGRKHALAAAPTDWPTYRHDPFRSGSTTAPVPADLKPLWTEAFGRRISAPTVAGGMVFLSVIDEHRVVALDLATGQRRWSYTVGGRVDTPPTIHEGLALFGARDGWVYCLTADTGELVWKFRAAPEDMRILAREQLESAWEIYGTVLVMDGVAYVSAGRHSEVDGGIFLYALEPDTGRVRWSRQIERPQLLQQASSRQMENEMNEILAGRDDVLFMQWRAYRTADGSLTEVKGPRLDGGRPGWIADTARPPLGWKHDFQQERGFWAPGATRRRGIGTIIDLLDNRLYVLDKDTHEVYCLTTGRKRIWGVSVPEAAHLKALAVTPETLFVAAVPDGADLSKGELWMYTTDKGEPAGTVPLPAAPAFEGIAAAAGRLLVCTQDGQLVCLGAPER